ncbi:MAG TPA: hypothetical protein VM223_24140, partial [Planctomycetota bacterium]|nr:hypothetical protein [Planctomycetota bacterium]
GKRSHQLLGCAALMEWLSVLATARPKNDSAVTLNPVAAQADSPHLLTRLVAIAACGALAPANADAEPRLVKALGSQDRLERLAGLWGCCVMEPGGGSPALQQAVRRFLRSRDAVECSFAARAAARVLPLQRAIEVLQDQCRSLPESHATAAMIEWMARTRPSDLFDPGDQVQNQMMLFDAVLESKNAALQSRFVRCVGNRDSFKNNDPLTLACITETEPEAFHAYLRRVRPSKLFAADAVLQRMAGLMRTADGKPNIRAVVTIVWWAMGNKEIMAARGDRIYAMIPPLETCFRPGASDEEIGRAGATVSQIITSVLPNRWLNDPQAPGKWSDVPPAVIAACRAYLGRANHPVYHLWVALTLADCYERITNAPDNVIDPGLFDAMQAARAAVMEKGSLRDQAIVLNAVASCADDSLAGSAIDELQKRFVAGTLPMQPPNAAGSADHFCYVLDKWLPRSKKPLSAEVVKCLIDRINAPAEDTYQAVLSNVIDIVASQPGTVEPLIAALQQLAEREPEMLGRAPSAIDLFRRELQEARKTGKPDPPWLPAAVELAPKIAAYMQSGLAEDAMRFYREAVGPEADAKIEAMVQDEKLAANLRAAAAAELFRANPDSKLLMTLAEDYDRLPVDMRESLARAALFAKNMPEGTAAFFARYYRDKQVYAHQRAWAMNHDHAPLSPELRPIFEELANDPDLGQAARQSIQRLDAEAAKQIGKRQENGK